MLPYTIVMMCTFEVRLVKLPVERLFPFVLELDLLVYAEFDGLRCSFSILLFTTVDLEADILGL
jgi:hypothetical protein